MSRTDEMPRPKLTRKWVAEAGDAQTIAKEIALDALTRRAVILFTIVVLALTVALAVVLSQWWWPVVGLAYLGLLDVLVYWTRLRQLNRLYRPGARFAVGFNKSGFRVSQDGSDGLFRYSAISLVQPKGSVVFMKIIRGRRVAWPREMFGEQILGEIQRRVAES